MLKSQKESLFWHRIWQGQGCPRVGTIAEIRRKSKASYHYAIRNAKHEQHFHKSQMMTNCILQNKSRQKVFKKLIVRNANW